MKKYLLLGAIAVVACSNVALETKTILVLADGTYRFNGVAMSFADLRTLLGDPALVQVNIKGCPRTREEAVLKLLRSLRSNGYSRIAFETGSADAACSP